MAARFAGKQSARTDTTSNDGLWFQEDLYPDIACGFRVSAVLHRERSAFQDILILDTPALGKVLVLDGVVQCAHRDEAIYHEMLRAGLLATYACLGGWFTMISAVKNAFYAV